MVCFTGRRCLPCRRLAALFARKVLQVQVQVSHAISVAVDLDREDVLVELSLLQSGVRAVGMLGEASQITEAGTFGVD